MKENRTIKEIINKVEYMSGRMSSMEESITNFTQLIKLIQNNTETQEKTIKEINVVAKTQNNAISENKATIVV